MSGSRSDPGGTPLRNRVYLTTASSPARFLETPFQHPMSSSAEQEGNPEETSLLPIHQLVAFWRDRAEKLRSQSPGMEARADVFEICAAQLAEAIASVGPVTAAETDRSSLELFGSSGPSTEGKG